MDHWGPRTPLLISISIAGVLGCVYPFCGRLWELVLLQGLFAGTKVIGGLGAMLMLVSRNFEMDEMEERVERDGGVEDKGSRRNRNGWGVSMGVSVILSGYSAAGVIAPIVVGSLAERWGWRVASGFMGGVFLGVGVPVCWRFLKIGEYRKGGVGGEERMGLLRDEGSAVVERKDGSGKVGNGKLEPVFTRGFVIMMVIVVLFAIPLHVVFDYFIDFLKTDIKYSLKAATMHYAAFNLVALVAKLFVGPLGDKYDKYALIILFAMVTVIGTLFLFDFGFSLAGGISFTVTKSLRKIALFVPICMLFYSTLVVFTVLTKQTNSSNNVHTLLFSASFFFLSFYSIFIFRFNRIRSDIQSNNSSVSRFRTITTRYSIQCLPNVIHGLRSIRLVHGWIHTHTIWKLQMGLCYELCR